MVLFGVGEMAGGYVTGQLCDKYSQKYTCLINSVVCLVMTAVTLGSLFWLKFNWLSFVMCFTWGYQDGSLNTHTMSILGKEFENASEPFCVFSFI